MNKRIRLQFLYRLSGRTWSILLALVSIIILLFTFWDFIIKNAKDIGVNAIGAYLGFISAAIIYLIQLGNDTSKERRDTIEKHKEHLRYFAGVMDDVVRYANSQADSVNELKESIERDPTSIHQLAFVASDAIGRLNRADNEAAFHAYNTLFKHDGEREKNYKIVLSQTDFIAAQLAAIKQSFLDYRDTLYKRQLNLKDAIQLIADETAFLLNEIREKGPATSFAKYAPNATNELNDLILRYISLNFRLVPFDEYFTEFITPLKIWLLNNERFIPVEHSSHQRHENLTRLAKSASVSLTDLKSNSLDFVKAFDASRLKKPAEKLSNVISSLEYVISIDSKPVE